MTTAPDYLRALADRIEARGHETDGLLLDAWMAVEPDAPTKHGDAFIRWQKSRDKFRILVEADAFLSAANMLRPAHWHVVRLDESQGMTEGHPSAPAGCILSNSRCAPHSEWSGGKGGTLEIALAAAALRAHAVILEATA